MREYQPSAVEQQSQKGGYACIAYLICYPNGSEAWVKGSAGNKDRPGYGRGRPDPVRPASEAVYLSLDPCQDLGRCCFAANKCRRL